jgi:hypothetical protein
MARPKSVFHLDADDYVYVTQTTGSKIVGRFDGQDYEFEDGISSEPIHWRVANHIFGFKGTETARLNAIHRFGWLNRMDLPTALEMLRKCVHFQPVELLPKGVVEFRRPEAQNEPSPTPVMPTAGEALVGEGAASSVPPAQSPEPKRAAHDPRRKAVQG